MASLATGRARIKVDGKDKFASVSGGFVMVKDGEVSMAALTFEFSEDIDVERAKAALDEAKATLSSATDDKTVKLSKAKVQRALTRIGVAGG